VDEGKLTWDEPVTRVYPSFRLGSPETTQKVLVRHLVCACTGLPRKDFDWIFDTRPDTAASTTFDELAATQPTSGFGEVFQYNNLMAAAAGYLGGHLVNPDRELGAAYDAAMQKEIFDPLGMGDTTFAMARALSGDHASPHGDDIDGRPTVASMDFNYMVEPYRPAGVAWSSAHDLIRYVGDELDQGRLPDGRRLVSAQNLLVRRAPGVATGEDAYYGMGLEGDRTWGVLVIHHGGSMAGFKSDIIFVPDAGVGAVILTNADDGGYLLRPFMRRLLEVLYDGKPEAAGDVAAAAARNQAEIAKERQRLVYPPAPALAADLAGAYVSPELGRITVRREAGHVVFGFGAWRSRVASRRNDDGTISFVTVDPATSGFEFVVATRSGKRALVIRDGQHEYVYTQAV
jgi:CubicO group peptidase (beta-lactamase class C family)